MNKIHPRILKSDPWTSVDQALDNLIDKLILEVNPTVLDDDIPDLLDNWDNREMAIEVLIDKLIDKKG